MPKEIAAENEQPAAETSPVGTETETSTPASTPTEETTAPESGEVAEENLGGGFLSPDALLIFPLAIFLDLVGIGLLCFGFDDFGVTDVIGIVFIGGWALFRSWVIETTKDLTTKVKETRATRKEASARIGKAAKNMKWTRIVSFAGELIPYIGALPFWTILVYSELKNQ